MTFQMLANEMNCYKDREQPSQLALWPLILSSHMSHPRSLVLDVDLLVPVAVDGGQGLLPQPDSTAHGVGELTTAEEGLKKDYEM